MEEMKYKNAQEFIEKEFDKFFGDRDLSKFPKTLTEEFDERYFCFNVVAKELYEILMNSEPIREFNAFYECLDTDKRKIRDIKTFTFEHANALIDKYNRLMDLMDEYNKEIDKIPIEGEPKDSTEFDIVSYIEILYDTEIRRIVELMKKMIKKGNEIIVAIDSINNDELDKKQVELLILLEDAKDTSKVEPETLVAGALDIYRQLQVNVLDENVVNKLCDACA